MSAVATARTRDTRMSGVGEHQKATYRVLVLGILALLGTPAFGLGVGTLSALYSLVLVVYALWALRLTVVFHDDDSLGYILCVFDVVLTAPLVLWGEGSSWAVGSLALVWVGGLMASVAVQRRERASGCARATGEVEAAGVLGPAQFRAFADEALKVPSDDGSRGGVVALRVYRFEEFVACHGSPAAERAVAALARRACRIAGEHAMVFRLRCDTLAVVVPGCTAVHATEIAAELSRAANTRLIEGRRVDSFVGYALSGRDGGSAAELVRHALGTRASAPSVAAPRETAVRAVTQVRAEQSPRTLAV